MLDRRFPEKDATDELAEVLNNIFTMRVKEGETLRQWISRATELFEKCERKSGCTFPEEARGYMVLKWSGLSDEQQAVVKGRALGVLKLDTISQSMRSVYPDFVYKKKSTVALVEEDREERQVEPEPHAEVMGFEDIEAFITEHTSGSLEEEHDVEETYEEADVAEILATTWKEKRAELTKLQRTRRFTEAKDSRRSFRVEVEELKKAHKVQSLWPSWTLGSRMPSAQGCW